MFKLTFLFCLFNLALFAQDSNSKYNLNTQDIGYGIHFEFKNHLSSSQDAELFKSIDFKSLEEQRSAETDVEVYIPEIDKTIVLYSVSKTIERKKAQKLILIKDASHE